MASLDAEIGAELSAAIFGQDRVTVVQQEFGFGQANLP